MQRFHAPGRRSGSLRSILFSKLTQRSLMVGAAFAVLVASPRVRLGATAPQDPPSVEITSWSLVEHVTNAPDDPNPRPSGTITALAPPLQRLAVSHNRDVVVGHVGSITIVATYGALLNADPNASAIKSAISTAIEGYTSTFSDPITVNITFEKMTTGLGQSSTFVATLPYNSFITLLRANALSADDAKAISLLPVATTNPVNGSSSINVKTANARAIGINAAVTTDSTISFNTNLTTPGSPGTTGQYNLRVVVQHEIDEALGLGSSLSSSGPLNGTIFPQDLFRYQNSGARSFTNSFLSDVFFRIDGLTNLAQFDNQNDGGDFGDWQSNPLPFGVSPKVQDAFGTAGANPTLDVELRALDAVGYDLVSASTNHTLTVQVLGQGTVSGAGFSCAVTGTAACSLVSNNTLMLSATAADGWTFSGWTGGCSGTGTCVATLGIADQTVGARFTKSGIILGGTDLNADGFPDLVWRDYRTGADQLWLLNGSASIVSAINLPAVVDTAWALVAAGDSNGDGLPDLFWRNMQTGANQIWLMSGPNLTGTVNLPSVPDRTWQIVASADMDRDGTFDLIWRNSLSGAEVVWYLVGGEYSAQASLPPVPDLSWRLVGAGDLNGDGKADLVWRNWQTGANVVWFMDNLTLLSQGSIPSVADRTWEINAVIDGNSDGFADLVWRNNVIGIDQLWLQNGANTTSFAGLPTVTPVSWRPAGNPPPVTLSDFNNDTWADLVWRNLSTGVNQIWFMVGTNIGSALNTNSVPDPSWRIVSVADMSGDSHMDIIWRHDLTGANVIWYMNGNTLLSQGTLPTVSDTSWQPRAGDLNGDGLPDLIWRNVSTGQTQVWYLNNTALLGVVNLPTVPGSWRIVGVADFDGDGYNDLLWHNNSTGGANLIWYMRNTTIVSQVGLPGVSDLQWEPVAVQDMNKDGYPDIVWRRTGTGENVAWLMVNNVFSSQVSLPTVPDSNWHLYR